MPHLRSLTTFQLQHQNFAAAERPASASHQNHASSIKRRSLMPIPLLVPPSTYLVSLHTIDPPICHPGQLSTSYQTAKTQALHPKTTHHQTRILGYPLLRGKRRQWISPTVKTIRSGSRISRNPRKTPPRRIHLSHSPAVALSSPRLCPAFTPTLHRIPR